jgi:toxin-antitoxin system PIN domain toxin
MIVPDVNLLLYAEIDAFPLHPRARRWWESALNGERQVGIAPVCLFGFLRIATNRRVLTDPLPADDAIERVQRWLERPHVVLLVPGTRHLETAFRLLRSLGTGGNLTTDVQIAAHAVDCNGEVFSNDRDFGRFEGVPWIDPLE